MWHKYPDVIPPKTGYYEAMVIRSPNGNQTRETVLYDSSPLIRWRWVFDDNLDTYKTATVVAWKDNVVGEELLYELA